MLVLASQSPRRKEILECAGLKVTVRISGVPEQRLDNEPAVDYVRRLACAKAEAVPCAAGETILGADTVVVLGGQVLEKPRDAADAANMLAALSGAEHK